MATVKFLLRNKSANKTVTIHYYINLSATNRIRGATGIKIHPNFWDEKNQKVRNKIEVSKIKDQINNKLSQFKAFIFNKLGSYGDNNINKIQALLKEDIAIYFGKYSETTTKKLTFYLFCQKFIEQSRNRVVEKTGRPISKRTIKEYERTIKLLKDFEKIEKYFISFQTINLDFYFAFKNYLERLDFSPNTIGKFIKQIKVFMNAATEEGLNSNLSFKNKRFIKTTSKSDQIYLNTDELSKIINLDLTNNLKLQNARDLFIVGAYTGLRVSDYNGLTKENIKTIGEKRFFTLTVKKTDKYLPIPLHPEVEKILKINNGNPPKKMPDQHINKAIKEIGKMAGIDDIITSKITKGGRIINTKRRKYELIVNHTARRSFCTNAYLARMSTLDIMAISGHTSEKTFLNYIKVSADERAIKIAESPFFNLKK